MVGKLSLLKCRQAVSKIPVKSITTQTIPGMDFNEIPIRIYQPADVDHRLHRQKGLPILLYLHGGGFFGGTLDTHDDLCRNLGRLSGYIVLSVAYRCASMCCTGMYVLRGTQCSIMLHTQLTACTTLRDATFVTVVTCCCLPASSRPHSWCDFVVLQSLHLHDPSHAHYSVF